MNDNDYKEALFYAASIFNERLGAEFSEDNLVLCCFQTENQQEVFEQFCKQYFPDSSDKDIKIVCRYPQYFAAVKLFENIKAHLRPEGDSKGGTYFGATGCGRCV